VSNSERSRADDQGRAKDFFNFHSDPVAVTALPLVVALVLATLRLSQAVTLELRSTTVDG